MKWLTLALALAVPFAYWFGRRTELRRERVLGRRLAWKAKILKEAIERQHHDRRNSRQTADEKEEGGLYMNPIVDTLKGDVTNAVGAMQSATVLINGFAAAQQAAIDKALANGATEEQLQPFVDIKDAFEQSTTDLANAVAANPLPTPTP